MLPQILTTRSACSCMCRPLADQSIFVRASIDGVVREATIAACLTGLMILIFLGSWRSTLIIAVSIPLSILTSIIVLSALGETINIMTLGGLALAVGILVDDATVEIENINRNIAMGKEIQHGILDGAQQIADAGIRLHAVHLHCVRAHVLSHRRGAVSVRSAGGSGGFRHAGFLPALANPGADHGAVSAARPRRRRRPSLRGTSRNPLVRMQVRFEAAFERFRDRYHGWLAACLHHRRIFLIGLSGGLRGFSVFLIPWLGRTSFPRWTPASSNCTCAPAPAPASKRPRAFAIRWNRRSASRSLPGRSPASSTTSGLPYSGINLSYSNSAPIGPADADILVSLTQDHHPTAEYIHDLRLQLPQEFPGVEFSFLPADIVSQILNFGLPAPIDVQVVGHNLDANREFADNCWQRMRQIPGAVDLRIQQPFNAALPQHRCGPHQSRSRWASPSATSPPTCWSR